MEDLLVAYCLRESSYRKGRVAILVIVREVNCLLCGENIFLPYPVVRCGSINNSLLWMALPPAVVCR